MFHYGILQTFTKVKCPLPIITFSSCPYMGTGLVSHLPLLAAMLKPILDKSLSPQTFQYVSVKVIYRKCYLCYFVLLLAIEKIQNLFLLDRPKNY